MENLEFIAVGQGAILETLGFLGNLAGPDIVLILLVVFFLFGVRKGTSMRGIFEKMRFQGAKSELTEDEERMLKRCDAVALVALVFIVGGVIFEIWFRQV